MIDIQEDLDEAYKRMLDYQNYALSPILGQVRLGMFKEVDKSIMKDSTIPIKRSRIALDSKETYIDKEVLKKALKTLNRLDKGLR